MAKYKGSVTLTTDFTAEDDLEDAAERFRGYVVGIASPGWTVGEVEVTPGDESTPFVSPGSRAAENDPMAHFGARIKAMQDDFDERIGKLDRRVFELEGKAWIMKTDLLDLLELHGKHAHEDG